ncbi:hypothetical protein PO902_14220 [Planococcus maritimus]|nr:hypothetical protein [Planococcus sp. SK3692]MDE4086199.1 hypothetical protein [Planococcus maritimus]
MAKNDILQRLQALEKQKKANNIEKLLAEKIDRLYQMDIEAMQYDIDKGLRTVESADKELANRRKKYFD